MKRVNDSGNKGGKLYLFIVAALFAASGQAGANTLTYQGVTFNTLAFDSDTLQLEIVDATSATGDWAGIGFLNAFEIKNIQGSGSVSAASISGPGTFASTVDSGLAAALGCTTSGTPGACFAATAPIALTGSMSWIIDFTGTNLNFDLPHLKVQFLVTANDTSKTGSLLSQAIPVSVIPEPEVYAMLAAGLGLIGFVTRRRKQRVAAV
jgi:hypothetical protein